MASKHIFFVFLFVHLFIQVSSSPSPSVPILVRNESEKKNSTATAVITEEKNPSSTLVVGSVMAGLCVLWIIGLLLFLCVFKKPLPEKPESEGGRFRDSVSTDSGGGGGGGRNWNSRPTQITRRVMVHNPQKDKKKEKEKLKEKEQEKNAETPHVTTLQQLEQAEEMKVPVPPPSHQASLPPIAEEEEVMPSRSAAPIPADEDSTHFRPHRVSLHIPKWSGKRAPSSGDW